MQRYSVAGTTFFEARIARDLVVFEVGRDYVLGLYEDADGEQHVVMYRYRVPK